MSNFDEKELPVLFLTDFGARLDSRTNDVQALLDAIAAAQGYEHGALIKVGFERYAFVGPKESKP